MSYLHAARGVTRNLCYFVFSIAVFLLWTALAAATGYVLLQLPDLWADHMNDENSRYAIMSVTAYALILGVLFLVFAAGAIEWLYGAARAARSTVRQLRRMHALRRDHHEVVGNLELQQIRQTL
ncbi:hypothetical protein [Paraburkholderia sp. BCC1886]|uniref:hypothetical protein n=1 Tax=Paraburkholderia sp. BCC1886 TaxID=2562670 RepID=UPI001642F5FA|nr:hypothetical protein [Paraburkholderia sp. BCC1886]